jgi:hypothetical protein
MHPKLIEMGGTDRNCRYIGVVVHVRKRAFVYRRGRSIPFVVWDGRTLLCQPVNRRHGAVKQTYRGSCHCGKVQFEVDADLDHVRVCDFSIRRRRGAFNLRVEPADFRLFSPLEDLSLYTFHTRTAKDYFCPNCGIQRFRRPRTDPSVWTINVRCLDGVDLDAIPIKRVHGSRLP